MYLIINNCDNSNTWFPFESGTEACKFINDMGQCSPYCIKAHFLIEITQNEFDWLNNHPSPFIAMREILRNNKRLNVKQTYKRLKEEEERELGNRRLAALFGNQDDRNQSNQSTKTYTKI